VTPEHFIAKWQDAGLRENQAAHQQFLDLCELLDEPKPADADPDGTWYCFERGARKSTGGRGWADVWKRGHFAWEYKSPGKDLRAAFGQLQQYALALENPPLLVVSDLERFCIHTNWTNTVSEVHEIALTDLRDEKVRRKLKHVFSDPDKLRPDKTRSQLTEEIAGEFAILATNLRDRGHDGQTVAHFVNRLVFCMFAEDIGLLPGEMFTRMLGASLTDPEGFEANARALFAAMKDGGRVGATQFVPSGGHWPRSIALGSDGNHLYAANRHSDCVVAFAVDSADGSLEPTLLYWDDETETTTEVPGHAYCLVED